MKSQNDNPYCKCLYYSANALGRIMNRMADQAFAATGLSASYAFLMMTVSHQPGISPKAISEHMLLSPSTVTRLIEKMEHKGYLKRQVEGKYTRVFTTEAGQALVPQIKQAWQSLYRKYSELLGEETGKQLTADIYQAVSILEA